MKRVNTYLAFVALVGALFCGSVFVYTHFSSLQNSKIVRQLEGDI